MNGAKVPRYLMGLRLCNIGLRSKKCGLQLLHVSPASRPGVEHYYFCRMKGVFRAANVEGFYNISYLTQIYRRPHTS